MRSTVVSLLITACFIQAFGHPQKRVFNQGQESLCPDSFDFFADGSCFKYASDVSLTRDEAEQYCEHNVSNGRLARLKTPEKYRAVMDFFTRIFQEERRSEDKTPTTAWTDGIWLPGSRTILYSDVSIDTSPKWMPKSRVLGNDIITWPTYRFGYDAICVAVSLWQPKMAGLGIREVSGLYNVYCDKLYRTHPMCETEV